MANKGQKVGFIELDEYQPAAPIQKEAEPTPTETPMPQEEMPQEVDGGFIPLDVAPEQVASDLGPKGVGPLADGQQYAEALQPEVEKQRAEDYGFGTVIRSAAETAFPPTNELTAKAYAAAYPELTEDQWYRVLTEREDKFHKESPVLSRVSDIAGAGAMIAPLAIGGAAAGVPAATGVLGAMGYGIATAPFVSQKRRDEPGYQEETAINTVVGTMAPVVGPGVVTAVKAPVRAVSKWLGKGTAMVMSKLAKDAETAAVYRNWVKDPGKYLNITDPKEARTEIYTEMSDALNLLKSSYEDKRITLKDTENSVKMLRNDYADALAKIEKRARELGETPSGTAEQIEKQFQGFKDKVYSLYDEAWDRAPTTLAWSEQPEKYGLPIEDFARSMAASVEKNTATLKGPEKVAVAADAANLLKYHVGEMVDDALKQRVISQQDHDFFKVNQELIYNPSSFISAINNPQNAKAFAMYGVSPQELVKSYRYINFMNPQEARNYSGSLFKRSSGFKSLADMANPSTTMLKGELGKKIAGDWRSIWLDQIGKNPVMKDWADQNRIAYHINNEFLKPLEKRFTIQSAAQESTTNQFIRAAQDNEGQILNSLRMASLVRGRMDQNLVDLASKLRASMEGLKSIGKLDFNSAIKKIAENQELADDTLSALSQLDPEFRKQFGELEGLAIAAKDTSFMYQRLAKEAEEFAKKYKPALSMRYGSIEGAVNKLGTGRASNINMMNARTEAEDGLRNLSSFMMNGDEGAANRAMQQLRNLRDIGLLDKRAARGSRETQQAAALGTLSGGVLGAATGAKVTPFAGAAAGVLANTFADRFTSGKWSSITPWLIEKMMNKKVLKYRNGIGRGLMSGVISREIGDGNTLLEILPGSDDAMQAIGIIKSDNKLTPVEKLDAIKKINDEGIIIEEQNNGQ